MKWISNAFLLQKMTVIECDSCSGKVLLKILIVLLQVVLKDLKDVIAKFFFLLPLPSCNKVTNNT